VPHRRPSPSKTDADVWLTLKEAEILNGDWTNPDDGKVPLTDYAQTWIAERPGLRPKTVELYSYLLRKHIAPVLGHLAIWPSPRFSPARSGAGVSSSSTLA